MANKLLLVDDEKVFLQSLKKGLEPLSSLFETHIAFSVSEAVKMINTTKYDLIITDIRMPLKTGIDLLLYLKKINFAGSIKVMSAHTTADNIKKINALGIMDVISKPFDLERFKNMLIDTFKKEEEVSVTFESIDLLSVMQVLNIDRKTSALQIDIKDKKGAIYFQDGEIIDAEFGSLRGEEAVLELIALNQGNISIKKIKNKVKKTIHIPFVEFMMDTMKKIDELRKKRREMTKKDDKNLLKNITKEEKMALDTVLNDFKGINGYKASGIMTFTGEILASDTADSKIDLTVTGATFNDIFRQAHEASKKIGLDACHHTTIETPKGLILMTCSGVDSEQHFHLIGVLASNGNQALMRLNMEKMIPTITAELS